MNNQLKTLRDGRPLKLWDKANKMFIQFQINKKDSQICWERYVSKDRINWVNWNKYLRLKDVIQCINELHVKNTI